ncbi:MAG: glycosyltransferase family 39 protein [Candidatus Alcyoniella australis]|nr:glycosyltransferase family 39 protein [Candidatus Alcyoniella australis]
MIRQAGARQQLLAGAAIFAALVAWIVLADVHSLNQDEGYYTRAALSVLEGDPLLSNTDLDKPPLLFWLMAPGIALLGHNELGVRLVGVLACLGILLLCGRIARRLAQLSGLDPRAARNAALWLCAASPYLLLLGPLGMTDAPAALLSLLAIDAALSRKSRMVGVWVGLAWAVRQLGLLGAVVPALMIFTLHLQAGDRGRRLLQELWRELRAFLIGFAIPVLPLMLWSGLAAREPFVWIFGEIFNKSGMAAPAADPLAKLGHWLEVATGFAPSAGLSLLGLAALIVLPAALRSPQQRTLRGLLWAMAAAAALFLALFTLWGFPRYPRYLFPLLPLCIWGLALSWSLLIHRLREGLRPIASTLLALSCVLSLIASTQRMAQPYPRDDLPALARMIRHEARLRPSAVISRDLNRQLLFYLHNVEIKRGQWHDDPADRIPSLLSKYEARRVLMLLQRQEGELENPARLADYAGKLRIMRLVATGPRDTIRIYEIIPAKQPRRTPEGLALYDARADTISPISAADLEQWVESALSRGLTAQGVAVNATVAIDDSGVQTVALSELTVQAQSIELDHARFSDLRLHYSDARALTGPLVSFGSLRLQDVGQADGSMLIRIVDLEHEIARKNRNMSVVRVQTAGERLTIGGQTPALGRTFKFEVSGILRAEHGRLYFDLISARLNGIQAPEWLLGQVASRINPVIKSSIPRLGLEINSAQVCPEGVRLSLGPRR